MQDFKKLDVWHRAHDLTLKIYKVTISYPDNERYGLVSQMRRCCASIPMNIAEGCGRGGEKEFARFLHIASGSALELEYQLILSRDLGLLGESQYAHINGETQQIQKMLVGLERSLHRKQSPRPLQ